MVSPADIPAVSVVDALVNELREQILCGKVVQGDPLRENELCAAFNVSRHTVRSAVQALSFERLVRHEPNRGVFVATVTEQDVTEIFRIRTILELEASRSIIGDASALSLVRKAFYKLRDLPKKASWSEIRDADLEFHQTLVAGLRSVRINSIFGRLQSELRLCFLQMQDEFSDRAEFVRQHAELLSQLESSDADKAVELMRRHISEGCDCICKIIASRHAPLVVTGAKKYAAQSRRETFVGSERSKVRSRIL